MKITAIKAQVKTPGRYSIFVDGKFSFGLSEGALIETGLVKDQELTTAELKRLKRAASDDKVYNLTLKWLARRLRSADEVRTYLKRKGTDAELSERIILKLEDLNLVDDLKFAKAYVSDRLTYAHASKRRLTYELRRKQVSADIIDQVLAGDELDDKASLSELIKLKRRQARYQDDLKLMQYLSRQGFNYGDIKEALNKA